jgi:hypothetical protein
MDIGGAPPPAGRWLASNGDWFPATRPPSGARAVVWTVLSAWLWPLLPVAIHYARKARREVDESQGQYVWSRSLLHRPVLFYLVVLGCGMALLAAMVANGWYGD